MKTYINSTQTTVMCNEFHFQKLEIKTFPFHSTIKHAVHFYIITSAPADIASIAALVAMVKKPLIALVVF